MLEFHNVTYRQLFTSTHSMYTLSLFLSELAYVFKLQVPVILEATTFSIKLHKRRYLVLDCLNQAPVDGSSGSSYGTSGGCSGSTKAGSRDF